jgi:hypothetical protein
MKPSIALASLTAALLGGNNASAQFAKANEAVSETAAGSVVTMPPTPASRSGFKVCAPSANCHAGSWRMVETASGLMECTEPWARPGSCRPSTYGAQKLARVWVVKRDGVWMQCQYPDLASRCTPMFVRPPANLPFDAIQ